MEEEARPPEDTSVSIAFCHLSADCLRGVVRRPSIGIDVRMRLAKAARHHPSVSPVARDSILATRGAESELT